MSRYQLGIKIVLLLFISSAATLMFIFDGCKRQEADKQKFIFDLAVSSLTGTVEKDNTSDLGKRAKEALSKLKNGIPDTEPMIVQASIGLVGPNDEPALFLLYFDEDSDLRGLRIKEQYFDPNGAIRTLEENYPLFVNALDTLIYEHVRFPVRVRDKHQRKDECLWLEYANRNLDGLILKYIDNRQQNELDSFVRTIPWKEEDMPPIYISIPDPNRVEVSISIYDRAGNESKSIGLLATPSARAKYLTQNNLYHQE